MPIESSQPGNAGTLLGYTEVTASKTFNGGSPALIAGLALPSITFDGVTAVWLEFGCGEFSVPFNAALNTSGSISLFLDGSSLYDDWVQIETQMGATSKATCPITRRTKLAPSAGAHVYAIGGYQSGAVTATIFAGGTFGPAYIACYQA